MARDFIPTMSKSVGKTTFQAAIDKTSVHEKLRAAFLDANRAMIPLFDLEMTRSDWDWPYEPTQRDIVDDGVLRQSYSGTAPFSTDSIDSPIGVRYLHSWNTAYALPVHEGYITRAGNQMPGRPWTKRPSERFATLFAQGAKKMQGLKDIGS